MSKSAKELLGLSLVTLFSTIVVWITSGMSTIYQNFDGPYYAVIAKTWYKPELIRSQFAFPLPLEYYAAHLPLYPGLMSLFSLTGLNLLQSGVLVTLFSTLALVSVTYLVWTKMNWPYPFWSAFSVLFIWPRMWAVRTVASPETLFILLILLSLFLFNKKQYLLAGILGAMATLTKSPGVLLFVCYSLWAVRQFLTKRVMRWDILPVFLIPLAFIFLCIFYYLQTGDFFAYFNSGDNIHLQLLPFQIFNSNQAWVGTFWLEDVLWIYFLAGLGVWYAFKKNEVMGIFGMVFLFMILFVSHRDISRYSLPIVPVVVLGFSHLFERKEIRYAALLWIIPIFLFTLNFLAHNTVSITDWSPFYLLH